MSTRQPQARLVLICCAALLAAWWTPALARATCGRTNACPVVDTVHAGANPVPAAGSVEVTCAAHDADGVITRFTLSTDSGVFSNGSTSMDVAPETQAATAFVAATWTAPSAPGTSCTLTCVAYDDGGTTGSPGESAPLATTALTADAALLPVVRSLTAAAIQVYPGQPTLLTAVVDNPQGGTLQFDWQASGGTLSTPNAAEPARTQWSADGPGSFVVSLTVTAPGGQQASAERVLRAVLALADAPLTVPAPEVLSPGRLAVDGTGNVYVTDSRARNVVVFTPLGERLRVVTLDGQPAGVAVAADGRLYVGDSEHGRVDILGPLGDLQGTLGAGGGEFRNPTALVLDPDSGDAWVADGAARVVRQYSAAGQLVREIAMPDGYPSGVAYDPVDREVYVGDTSHGTVRVFSAQGLPLRVLGSFGSGAGQLTRVGGVTLGGDGMLYAVDPFQSRVAVFQRAGAFVGFVGEIGSEPGQLRVPLDAVTDRFQRLLVSNGDNGRVEVYRLAGATALACGGDSDCDGLPDAWELAHGLDPNHAADSYLDPDGDGIVNLAEMRLGTDPQRVDSDGDGVADGVEVTAGQDPANPADNQPTAHALVDAEVFPGLLVLDGSTSTDPNGDPLGFDWAQLDGPAALEVHDFALPTAWTVVRAGGVYTFRLRVQDPGVWSPDALFTVRVRDVAPTADPGPVLPARAGSLVTLDGRASADANGDALSFAWSLPDGSATGLTNFLTSRAQLAVERAGVTRVELQVQDASASSLRSSTAVVACAPADHVPVAVVAPEVTGTAGTPVHLDGLGSVDGDGDALSFAWAQVDGEPLTLEGADAASLVFIPANPGVVRLQLVVRDGQHASLPAVTTVVVQSDDEHPPRAAAGADQHARVRTPVTLNGALSEDADGDILTFSWRQVQGVWVPLRSAGSLAEFTPVEPGLYTFELEVADAHGPGTRDQVTVAVEDPEGLPLPVAVVSADAPVAPGLPVVLHAEASHDGEGAPVEGCTWTQQSGPAVEFSDAHAVSPRFIPPLAGRYTFALQVDNAGLRSLPALVEIVVSEPVNESPVARAGADLLVRPGVTALLDGRASLDPEGVALTYAWAQVAGPLDATTQGLASAQLSVTPAQSGFTLGFALTVEDGQHASAPDTAFINVVDEPLGLVETSASPSTFSVSNPDSPVDGLAVDVPAGALADAGGAVALGLVTREWLASAGRERLGPALLVGPAAQPFASALRVRFPVPGTALRTAGVTPAQLQVSIYDQAAGTWHSAPGATVDLVEGAVELSLTTGGVVLVDAPAGWSTPLQGTDGGHPDAAQADAGTPAADAGSTQPGGQDAGTPEPEADSHSGCGGCQGARGGVDLSLLLGVLGLALLRTRRARLALAVAAGVGLGGPVRAASAPHDSTNLPQGCQDCHIPHNAPGSTLTSVAGNANLCMSCHSTGQMAYLHPFATGDQATLGVTGVSHRWDANATNAAMGALPPTNPELAARLNGGKLTCSVCHDQHSQTHVPFDPRAPVTAGAAGRHFLRIDNNSNQLCLDCHRPWDQSSAATWTGSPLSHPVRVPVPASADYQSPPHESSGVNQVAWSAAMSGTATGGTAATLVDSSKSSTWSTNSVQNLVVRFTSGGFRNTVRPILSNTSTTLTFASLGTAILAGTTYEIDADGNVANNLVLDNGGVPSFTTGQVLCMTCHRPHFADSNTATHDTQAGAGDGHLLARSNTNDACTGCHVLQVHNSTTTHSARAAWGAAFTCQTCHAPHNTANVFLVKGTLATPNSGNKTVDLRAVTGGLEANGLASTNAPGSGPCEACHTDTRNGSEYATGAASFTAGSTTVTCTTTCNFTGNVVAGFEVKRSADPPSAWTRVASVTNTTLTLATGYRGTTGAGGPYQAANPRFRTTGSGRGAAGTEHYATNCLACHPHSKGFAAGESSGASACDGCHNDLWQRMRETAVVTTTKAGAAIASRHRIATDAVTSAAFADNGSITWSAPLQSAAAPSSRSCVNMCHADHPHTTDTDTTHASNAYVDATTYSSRANNNGAATQVATNATRAKTDFDATASNGGMCLSCHRFNVDANHPAIDKTTYTASAHNSVSTSPGGAWSYDQHSPPGGAFQRNCTKCHGERADARPADGSFPFEAVHYSRFDDLLSGAKNAATTQGTLDTAQRAQFLCYNCHGNATVGADFSGKNIQAATDRAATPTKRTTGNRCTAASDCFTNVCTSNVCAVYAAGTATFTTGSATVTCASGTCNWATAGVGPGWVVRSAAATNQANAWYGVVSATDATLTLRVAFAGTTATAVAYQADSTPSGHPVDLDATHQELPENTNSAYGAGLGAGVVRHASCTDCHDEHAARAGGHTYTTGSATFSAGSTAVVGTGTLWSSFYAGGRMRNDATGTWYTVASVTDATHLTLSAASSAAGTGAYTLQKANSLASPALEGGWGTKLSTPPAFWAAPAAGAFTKVRMTSTTTPGSGQDNLEASLCFKCHSAYSWGSGTAPVLTSDRSSGGTAAFTSGSATVTGTGTSWNAAMIGRVIKNDANGTSFTITAVASATSLTISPAATFSAATGPYTIQLANTDTAREFNPSNAGNWKTSGTANTWDSGEAAGSFHPVLADCSSNLGAVTLTNLVTTHFPWSTTTRNRMTCGDCHGSDQATDPVGPHGSAAKFILSGPNTVWNSTATYSNTQSGARTVCANCHTIGGSSSRFTSSASGNHTSQHTGVPCFNCHVAIPHGSMRPGLLMSGGGAATTINGGLTTTTCLNSGATTAPTTCVATDNPPYNQSSTGSRLQLRTYPTTQTGGWNATSFCYCGTGTSH